MSNAYAGEQVLVVTFASAPGTPNWGNLLGRIRKSADLPGHNCFDILYVVDAARAWYEGQDAPGRASSACVVS